MSKSYFNLLAVLTVRKETWIYQLCHWFEDLREYFDELASPLYLSILKTEKLEANESSGQQKPWFRFRFYRNPKVLVSTETQIEQKPKPKPKF